MKVYFPLEQAEMGARDWSWLFSCIWADKFAQDCEITLEDTRNKWRLLGLLRKGMFVYMHVRRLCVSRVDSGLSRANEWILRNRK